ncbi:nucleolar complex protein 2 homolog [Physella acuta]|uniref:nucleolar complex protein 2 homolog n=1 Tax=Physella acuta TaxID=109671 RepID=UPI0027DAFEE0|nr:nucleolar complex protein 2 homolog [Physella acuta]
MAAHINSMGPAKKKLKEMNVDEFLNADFSESESSSNMSAEITIKKNKKIKQKKEKHNNVENKVASAKKPKIVQASVKKIKSKKIEAQVGNSPKEKQKADKNSLALTLQKNDPEFYDFLKGQDKSLLDNLEDLSESDGDFSDENEDMESDVSGKEKKVKGVSNSLEKELLNMSSGDESDDSNDGFVHKPPENLEVASDDSSDDEAEVTESFRKDGTVLTHKIIEQWTTKIQSKPSPAILKEIVSAFHSALKEAGGHDDDENYSSKYIVEGGAIFNSIVRLCLTQVVPALQTMLQVPAISELKNVMSDKSLRWKKLKVLVKSYISALLELLTQLSDAVMVNAILKHVHKLVIFYASFPTLTKLFLKRMINMWTTGEETTRVLAFLCINKIVHLKKEALLETTIKKMYMAYVSNCKFTSPSTLPLINFMQKSLVEIFNIDQTLGAQYAFVYIRQLAIHLRNAITLKKKATCQTVYNWQYIHCLGLWVQLLTTTYPSEVLQPLIYPLTQTIVGTIKLLPTTRYYPLRFHCVQFLNKLSYKTKTYIPTMPFLLEIFDQVDFNKKHKTVSLKPFYFAVILKFSKAQLHEKAFKDGLIDQLYEHLLESFNTQAHSISFPELIIPAVIQLKSFLKKCKTANYCKQIKQIVDKIQEQAKFVTEKRKQANVSLHDQNSVDIWEDQLLQMGTPLRKFYTSWRKLRDRELLHEISNKEAVSGAAIDIPTIERKRPLKATQEDREDFSKLFENDSESDDETRFLLKEDRQDNNVKKRKRSASLSDSEDYSDFDEEELEQLAQSADEDSADESDGESDEGGSGDSDDDGSGESDEDSSGEGDDETNVKKNKKINGINKKASPTKASHANDEDDQVEDFALSDFDSD